MSPTFDSFDSDSGIPVARNAFGFRFQHNTKRSFAEYVAQQQPNTSTTSVCYGTVGDLLLIFLGMVRYVDLYIVQLSQKSLMRYVLYLENSQVFGSSINTLQYLLQEQIA